MSRYGGGGISVSDILSDSTPYAGADIAVIKADTQIIEDSTLKAAPTNGSLARFIVSGGTALGTQLPDSKSLYDVLGAATGSTLGSLYAILGNPAASISTTLALKPSATDIGVRQVFEKSITVAANAGATTVGTVTTQACVIESIIIHADAAQTTDLTTCAVTGAAGSVTFIPTSIATQANLDTADNQVSTGIISVRLAATKTIVITPVGTGATALDLTVVVTYYSSSANGGTIS